ncbi:Disease resistance protein TAO1 [Vitis vinifera]|uniref:ADP-ribosyl cyclase/cyclic ADP-ribose hydrolase n=1 Tax=Vitis vinifera TaxID=29760 RepID=A0A438BVZ9_VITVI|nr:Disease resistance protein TAO1 [Vitis vinifera]
MASSSTSLLVPSSSSAHRLKYDLFLSFRGEDTRQSFTAHLHAALCQKGINTFKDNQLRRGEKISPALLQAIEESRCSIIIFSENYASSSWCLDELTRILECVKMRRQTALPVFHNVDPSHVRKQEGSFAKAFAKHEQVYKDKMEQVVKWRDALTEAATISGWDSRNRDESEVIEEIVTRILNEPIDAFSSNVDALVGMDSRMEDLLSLLCIGSDDVRFVGIWGMAGIARLHSKKVLIVLDNVVHRQELEALVGSHDWFGPGSRIIITTREKRLLIEQEVNAIYEVEKLEYDEALKLFCQYAFRYKHPTEDFMQLCHHAVDYTGSLPLALKVLGSCLYRKSIHEWKSELDKLNQFPNKEVLNVLKTSFDGLDDNEKNMFLDIAFFYKGEDKDFVIEVLDNFFPVSEIGNLVDKSLITISDNKFYMHDLLQEMGWEIVRQESIKDPGKRSRLRVHEDIHDVLTTNKGTEAVEGMVFDLSASKELNLSVDAFAKMNKLRLLRFYNCQFYGRSEYLSEKELIASTHDAWRWMGCDNSPYNDSKLHLSIDFKFPSNNLRSLHWHGYPLESLPSNFHPEKLVELNMCYSLLKQLWEGKKAFKKLKFIKLSHSQHLTKTPDFSAAPKLRRIILNGCASLVKLHPSIGALKELIFLNLEGCSKLEKFPEVIQGNLEDLSGISLEGTAIRELPSSIGGLNRLVLLNLRNCKKLASLPQSICELISLQTLTLSGCSKLKKLPDDLGRLQCLVELHVDGTGIKEVPSSINLLTNLQALSLAGCKGGGSKSSNLISFRSSPAAPLQLPFLSGLYSLKSLNLSDCNLLEGALPSDLSSLSSLENLYLDKNSFITLPASLSQLSRLKSLTLEHCKSLQSLPELPSSVESLNAHSCTSLETFSCSSSAYTSKKFGDLRFNFTNCFRLGENQGSDIVGAILEGIQLMSSIPKFLVPDLGIPTPRNEYNALVPGSRIPEWFRHQSVGCSVNIELPPHWYNTKLMGLAFCAALNFKGAMDGYPGTEPSPFGLVCYLNDCYVETGLHSLYTPPEGSRFIESDHTLFEYKSLARLEICLGNWFRKLSDNVVASFALTGSDGEVKKCGIRLVYEEDEKDGGCSFPFGTTWPGDGDGDGDEDDSNYKKGLLMDPSAPSKSGSFFPLHHLCSPYFNEEFKGGSS